MYPQVFGKYVLERELSRGGMARVVLATLRGAGGFEKKLVVKQIRDELAYDQQFVRRFVEEAKTTVALSHPNIVPVYELGVEAGTYFLAMELVEGCSIAELQRERNADGTKRRLTPEEGAYVGIEVCRALDYAHRRMKVVHRDITPRNVMLDEEGQVKLIDFGIAAPALVAGHEILGSPGHMPPEQVEGKELGPGTDLFAVAVLLMEAWGGVATFRRQTPEACDAAMREPHPRPSDYDPRLIPLDDIITSCLSLDPAARPKDANELGRALRNFVQGIDVDDIARDLGERVRDMREVASSPSPPSSHMAMRPSQASHGDFGTKTFAAREEALRWSSPPPSIDSVEAPAPSTRRMADKDPMMSVPTPLMIEPLEKLETIATRPLETPVRLGESKAPSSSSETRRSKNGWVLPALVVVGAIGGFAAWKTRSNPGPLTANPLPVTPTPSATPSLPITKASGPAIPTPPVSVATNVNTSPTSAAPTASTIVVGRGASVLLLGEPGTRVSIDGAPRGACPVRLTLEPGAHDARFIFDPTGESRGERISVKAGDKVTVRADFTGASPTVTIFR